MRALPLILAVLLGGCSYVSFRRPATQDELITRGEIKSFYERLTQAFAIGNPDALSSLFSPSITHPMTMEQIRAWSQKFFAEHGKAHFKIQKLDIESLSYINAVVVLTYRVDTPDGKGGFGATERDTLVRSHGQWYVASWDKVDPNEKAFDTILPLKRY